MRQFLYGSATSSHQVEGGNRHNDWWEWEQSGGAADRSREAADHWNLWKDDLDLAKSLGQDAHRLSLEWSRIELENGQYNSEAIAHYRELLEYAKSIGLKTFLTINHFTLPIWLARKGGWENKESVASFSNLAGKVAQELSEVVDFWITINEPMVLATQGYWRGVWPPGKQKDFRGMWQAIKHLAKAHNHAYAMIKTVDEQAQIGVAKHWIAYLPAAEAKWSGRVAALAQDYWFNWRFMKMTAGAHDFIGINHYFFQETVRIDWLKRKLVNKEWKGDRSDLGWPIWSDGLLHVLKQAGRLKKPIYVTEHGLADAKDIMRADFITQGLRAIEQAQVENVDVQGYLHWSLLDNFEWAEGFEPRFGLVEVDYSNQTRRPRPSAYVYKAIIEQARAGMI